MPEFIETTKLILNTAHSTTGTDGANATFNFQSSHHTHGHVVSIMPIDIAIPNGFYNVTADNRRIQIGADSGIWVIDMPLGFYSAKEWLTEFALQLNAVSSGQTTVASSSINPFTDQITITMNEPWDIDPATSPCSPLIGLTSFISSTANAITFQNPTNFSGTQFVVVEMSIGVTNAVMSSTNTTRTVLDVVNLANTAYGKYTEHKVHTDNVRAYGFGSDQNVSSVTLRLLDVNGNQLTLPSNLPAFYHLIINTSSD